MRYGLNRVRRRLVLAASLSLLALGVPVASAQETQRIAFSSSLGVDVLGTVTNGTWCSTRPNLILSATNGSFFQSEGLNTLVTRLAAGLIEDQCPQADVLDLSGQVAGQEGVVYRGEAQKSARWAVTALALPPADAPVANTAATSAPTATEPTTVQSATPVEPRASLSPSAVAPSSPPTAPASKPSTTAAAPRAIQATVAPPAAGTPDGPPPHPALADRPDPAPATPGSGWIGQWTGQYECQRENRDLTISINQVSGLEFQGAFTLRSEGRTRNGYPRMKQGRISGVFEPTSAQFTIMIARSLLWDALGDELDGGSQFTGVFNFDSLSLERVEILRSRCPISRLTKTSDTPSLADQIDAEDAWREQYFAYLRDKPRPNWALGKEPSRKFSMPSCEALFAWSESIPAKARYAPSDRSRTTILRHFDDTNTVPIFGKAAATWSEEEWWALRGVINQCGRTPRAQAMRDIATDGDSKLFLRARAAMREAFTLYVAQRAAVGDDDATRYFRLSYFVNPENMISELSKLYISRVYNNAVYSGAELAELSQDLGVLAASLAPIVAQPYRELILASPETARGINGIAADYQEAIATLGEPGRAQVQELGTLAVERQQTIAVKLIEAAKAELAKLPSGVEKAIRTGEKVNELNGTLKGIAREQDLAALRELPRLEAVGAITAEIDAIGKLEPTLEALKQANTRVSSAEVALADLVAPAALLDLRQALRLFSQTARVTVLEAAIQRIRGTPATAEGLSALRADEMDVLAAVSDGPRLPEQDAYSAAVQAKADEIGEAAANILENSLALIEPSFRALDEIGALQRQFAYDFPGVTAQDRVAAATEAKRQSVLDVLADEAISELQQQSFQPMDYGLFLSDVSMLYRGLDGLDATAQADRIREAGIAHANKVLAEGLDAYRSAQLNMPAERRLVPELRQAANTLDADAKTLSGLTAYAQANRDAASSIIERECAPVLEQANIGRPDREKTLLVAGQASTLGDFACKAYAVGFTPSSLKTPGLFGGHYEIQLFSEQQKVMYVIGFTEAEALPGQKLLVGTTGGDAVSTKPMNLAEWNALTEAISTLADLGDGLGLKAICAQMEGNAGRLRLPFDLQALGTTGVVLPTTCG